MSTCFSKRKGVSYSFATNQKLAISIIEGDESPAPKCEPSAHRIKVQVGRVSILWEENIYTFMSFSLNS